jgi:hypothetical protein
MDAREGIVLATSFPFVGPHRHGVLGDVLVVLVAHIVSIVYYGFFV